jgi:hypothetical protein
VITKQQPPKVSLRNVRAAAAASLQNERATRQRVEHLESWAGATAQHVESLEKQIDATTHVVGQHMDFLQMPFMARLRWLFSGALPSSRIPPVTKSKEAE